MSAESDFASVLQAARVGAEWAWTLVYREHAPGVLRYLKAHGAPDPEDLLGDVFVQLVRTLPGFDGDRDEFRAWLFTIARNRLIDQWRHERRRPVEPLAGDALAAFSPTGDIEAEAMERLGDRRVREIAGRLTRDQRDVLFLRVLVGLTVRETAAVLGKSDGAVKSLQARALAAVRRRISKEAVSI